MSAEERRTYLAESLFLNTVKYENDKLEAYMRKLEKAGGAKGSASFVAESARPETRTEALQARRPDAARPSTAIPCP